MILTDERFKQTKLICNENYERMRGMQMEVAGFLALGILVGLLGALLGIGGGMVIVPLLVFAWDYEPQLAIGTSVLMVLMNAVSGTWGYIRQKKVCVDAALKFAVGWMIKPSTPSESILSTYMSSVSGLKLLVQTTVW